MKRTILPALLTVCLAGSPALAGRNNIDAVLGAQTGAESGGSSAIKVAPEVEKSAVDAVKALGAQVMAGNHKVALERMYPAWKEKLTATVPGGVKAMEAAMETLGKQMRASGTTITGFETAGPITAYEVDAGKEPVLDAAGKPVIDEASGKPAEKIIFKKYLLVVPTITKFRFMVPPADPGGVAKPAAITSKSFQLALSDKGKNDWTFIDGATLKMSELRRLFFNLPQDMPLPEVKKEEDPKAK